MNNNVKAYTISPKVYSDNVDWDKSKVFMRVFSLSGSNDPLEAIYSDTVRLKDHVVINCKHADNLEQYGIAIVSGEHKTGDYVLDIQEPIVYIRVPSPQDSESSDGIDTKSNEELLDEIFDIDNKSDFSEDDVLISQLRGKVETLEQGMRVLCRTVKALELQMKRLDKNNQDLLSLVTQVLNHEVPDDLAKNILEDIFKENI